MTAAITAVCLSVWAAAVTANPITAQAQAFLSVVWVPAVVVLILMVGLAVAPMAFVGTDTAPPEDRFEPLLPRPKLPPSRRREPLVSFHKLEPGVGSSTLCFNLGVLLAAEGTVDSSSGCRRLRPISLLEAGGLTERLKLDPQPLTDYFSRNPVSLGKELLDFATLHPAGVELLSIGEGAINGQRLRLLLPFLRAHYDVILLDCPSGDRWLTEVAVELSELALVVGLPSVRSAAAGGVWAEEAWRRGFEARSAVVVNRVTSDDRVPESLVAGFLHQAQLPDDSSVAAADSHALPWSLEFNSIAARHLREAARGAFGDVLRTAGAADAA